MPALTYPWGAPAAYLLACASAALACYLVPKPASARSARAVVAAVMLIGFGWLTVGYLLGPRPDPSASLALASAGAMALIAAWRAGERQERAWLGAFGLAMLLIGASDLLLARADVVGDARPRISLLVGVVGSVVLIVGQVRSRRALTAVAAATWAAWLAGLAQAGGDRVWSLLCLAASVSAGCLVAAWIGREAGTAIAGAAAAELSWLLVIVTGRGWWSPVSAPLEAYTLGSLAIATLLIALLVRAGSLPWSSARRALAALALAVGVASLSALAWSASHGPTSQVAGTSWLGLAGLLGWLAYPAGPYRGPSSCDYCGDRDQSGNRVERSTEPGRWARSPCLGLCGDAGRERAGPYRVIRAVRRRD